MTIVIITGVGTRPGLTTNHCGNHSGVIGYIPGQMEAFHTAHCHLLIHLKHCHCLSLDYYSGGVTMRKEWSLELPGSRWSPVEHSAWSLCRQAAWDRVWHWVGRELRVRSLRMKNQPGWSVCWAGVSEWVGHLQMSQMRTATLHWLHLNTTDLIYEFRLSKNERP
jgi:hypothetical protein